MSLVCSRAVIIVIREIYKFDDRPDNGASVQVYYRLSMCMQEASAKASQSRLASSRDKATVDRGIHNRNMFCVYIYVFFFFISLLLFFDLLSRSISHSDFHTDVLHPYIE
jgi:hypothetical protein